MKKLILSAALLSLSSVGFANSLNSMNATQIKNALTDKTITTVSQATLNDKLIDNSFTGYINKDGTMEGKFANALPDGSPQADKGKWKIQANQFCYTWENWDHAKPKCVTFYQLTNALLVIGPGKNFETLILDSNIQNGNQMG